MITKLVEGKNGSKLPVAQNTKLSLSEAFGTNKPDAKTRTLRESKSQLVSKTSKEKIPPRRVGRTKIDRQNTLKTEGCVKKTLKAEGCAKKSKLKESNAPMKSTPDTGYIGNAKIMDKLPEVGKKANDFGFGYSNSVIVDIKDAGSRDGYSIYKVICVDEDELDRYKETGGDTYHYSVAIKGKDLGEAVSPKELYEKSRECGKKAFKDGKEKSPAQDEEYLEYLKNINVGDIFTENNKTFKRSVKNWLEGYEKAKVEAPAQEIDEELADTRKVVFASKLTEDFDVSEITTVTDFDDLKDICWSGALDRLRAVEDAGLEDEFFDYVDENISWMGDEGGTLTTTQLNDFIWFDCDDWLDENVYNEDEPEENDIDESAKSIIDLIGKKKVVEEYGYYKDEPYCDEIADSLENGLWYGETYNGTSWELTINGKGWSEFSPSFADYMAEEISYPVRDGHLSYNGIELLLYKSSMESYYGYDDLDRLTPDLITLGADKDAINEWLKDTDPDAEFSLHYDFEIAFDVDEWESNEGIDESKKKGRKKKLEEDEDSINDDRAIALAEYLNVEPSAIEYRGNNEYGEEEYPDTYLVLTEEEAYDAAIEDVKNVYDDLGLESFTPTFQDWILDNAAETGWFYAAFEEMEQSYVDDIENETDSVFENRLIAELVDEDLLTEDDFDDWGSYEPTLKDTVDLDDLKRQYVERLIPDDPVKAYKDEFGKEEFRDAVRNNDLVDIDKVAEEAVSVDGVAHFIASYDGEEIELSNGYYAYRTN